VKSKPVEHSIAQQHKPGNITYIPAPYGKIGDTGKHLGCSPFRFLILLDISSPSERLREHRCAADEPIKFLERQQN